MGARNTPECAFLGEILVGLAMQAAGGTNFPLTLRLQKSPAAGRGQTLLAEAEPLHHVFVAIGIVSLEVVEQATPLADQHEKATARAMIFLVRFEVLRQLADPLT